MAESQAQFTYDEAHESSIRVSLTEPRLGKYLREGGHNFDYAMALYLWNARLCKSLQFPLHSVEVTLRNAINAHLKILKWPDNWAFDEGFLESLEGKSPQSIDTMNRSKRRILKDKLKKHEYNNNVRGVEFRFVPDFGRLNTDDVIANLPFEYWVAMLGPQHEPDWHTTMPKIFPHTVASITRKALWLDAEKVTLLRNRVAHHEPIFHMSDLMDTYKSIHRIIGFRNEAMGEWVKHHSTFLQTWHQKPRPDGLQAGRKLLSFVEKADCVEDLEIPVSDLIERSRRKRRNCIVLRRADGLQVLTSDDISVWLESCKEVGLADLSITIREFTEITGDPMPIQILSEDATTGMARAIFQAPADNARPRAIVITSNGRANGKLRGVIFKPDYN